MIGMDVAEAISKEAKSKGAKIGMCHGVFDLLHPGHFAHFNAAKSKVDILFVSITTDLFVKKGPGRPLFQEKVRAATIAMLECVDYVVFSNHETAMHAIEVIRPNLYFKGSDYRNAADDVTGMILKEVREVEKYGGSVEFTDELTSSSTSLINQHFSNKSQELEIWLESFKRKYSTDQVNHYLDLIKDLRVGVLGEIIVDKYTNCDPLAKSSKDPILAFHELETKTYLGGVLAIRDNLMSWIDNVFLYSISPLQIPTEDGVILEAALNSANTCIVKTNTKFIVKHRYVDVNSGSRVFEIYDYDPTTYFRNRKTMVEEIRLRGSQTDVFIVADFGHGLIPKEFADELSELDVFLAVNTQSNAGNRGYNTITKYSRANFISLNGAELQLELRDKNPNYERVVPQYMNKLGASYAVVTLGSKGMMVFADDAKTLIPALGSVVVDKVGAGDSVLAIGSCLARVDAPIEIIALICSIVAAHEISQLGHQSSLKISDLKKSVKGLIG